MRNVVPLRRAGPSFGLIHVVAEADGLHVLHESASGSSFAILDKFGAHERDAAVRAALDALPTYAPCRLGEIVPWS